MARAQRNSVLNKPLPSTSVPWLVILCLLAAIVLVFLFFLRPADKLLGKPLPQNEYRKYLLQKPRPAIVVPPANASAVNLAPLLPAGASAVNLAPQHAAATAVSAAVTPLGHLPPGVLQHLAAKPKPAKPHPSKAAKVKPKKTKAPKKPGKPKAGKAKKKSAVKPKTGKVRKPPIKPKTKTAKAKIARLHKPAKKPAAKIGKPAKKPHAAKPAKKKARTKATTAKPPVLGVGY